jgi:hypothetical protein
MIMGSSRGVGLADAAGGDTLIRLLETHHPTLFP